MKFAAECERSSERRQKPCHRHEGLCCGNVGLCLRCRRFRGRIQKRAASGLNTKPAWNLELFPWFPPLSSLRSAGLHDRPSSGVS